MPSTTGTVKKEASGLRRFLIPALVLLIGIGAFVVRYYLSVSVTYAPYDASYTSKPDFAQLEHLYPLSPQQLMTITPQSLKRLDQEKVNQIYAPLTAGPIPDGPYDGYLFLPNHARGQKRPRASVRRPKT